MDRPKWVSALDWARLEPVLDGWPAPLVDDALADLRAATAAWEPASRARLLERFVRRAGAGAPLPAAFVLALTDLLGAAPDE